MKMHLPLGLRRALFNTFIALAAASAVSTAQAADFAFPDATTPEGTVAGNISGTYGSITVGTETPTEDTSYIVTATGNVAAATLTILSDGTLDMNQKQLTISTVESLTGTVTGTRWFKVSSTLNNSNVVLEVVDEHDLTSITGDGAGNLTVQDVEATEATALRITIGEVNLNDDVVKSLSIGESRGNGTVNAQQDLRIWGRLTSNNDRTNSELNMGSNLLEVLSIDGYYGKIVSQGQILIGSEEQGADAYMASATYGTDLDVTIGGAPMTVQKVTAGYKVSDSASTDNTLTVTRGSLTLDDGNLVALTVETGGSVTAAKKTSISGALTITGNGVLDMNQKELVLTERNSLTGTVKGAKYFKVGNGNTLEVVDTHDLTSITGDGQGTLTVQDIEETPQTDIKVTTGEVALNDQVLKNLNLGEGSRVGGVVNALYDTTVWNQLDLYDATSTLNMGKHTLQVKAISQSAGKITSQGKVLIGSDDQTGTDYVEAATYGTDLDVTIGGAPMTVQKVTDGYKVSDSASTDNTLEVAKGEVTLEDDHLAALTINGEGGQVTAAGAMDAGALTVSQGTLDMDGKALTVTSLTGTAQNVGAFTVLDAAEAPTLDVAFGTGEKMDASYADGAYILKDTSNPNSTTNTVDVKKGTVTLDDPTLGTLKVGSAGEADVKAKVGGFTISTLAMETTGSSLTAETISATTVNTTAGMLTATGDTATPANDGALDLGSGSITDTDVEGGALTAGGKDDTTQELLTITGGSVDVDSTKVSAGDALTLVDTKGDLGTVTVEKGAHLTLKDIQSNDTQKLTGDIMVTDASFTMDNATLHGNVTFANSAAEGDTHAGESTFTIVNDNHLYGNLTTGVGTTTVQLGTLTLHDAETSTDDGQGGTTTTTTPTAIIVDGDDDSTHLVASTATLNGDVEVVHGTLDIQGKLDADDANDYSLTFKGEEDDKRVVEVNTVGSDVNIGTLVMEADGEIAVNGQDNAGTSLTLHKLVGESGKILTLTQSTGDSTVVFDTNNGTDANNFKSDIDSEVARIEVKADEALGSSGKVMMQNGSTLANTGENAVTISKEIEAAGGLTIDAGKGMTLKGDVTAQYDTTESAYGIIDTTGSGELVFSGAELQAQMVNIGKNGNQKVTLEGETVTKTSIQLHGTTPTDGAQPTTLVIKNLDATTKTTLDADSGLNLGGDTQDAVVVQVVDEFSTQASVAVTGNGGGTMQTDAATTLNGKLVGGGTLVKTGTAALTLTQDNSVVNPDTPAEYVHGEAFVGTLEHTEGKLAATSSGAFGTERATVQLNKDAAADADAFIVELNAQDGTFANKWDAQTDGKLVVTKAAELSGAMSGNGGILTKTGEKLTLTGQDASFDNGGTPTTLGTYTLKVADGEAELNNTKRDGTFAAAAGTDIYVKGGESTVGALELTGDGNAAHNTPSDAATRVHIGVVGQDTLASATGDRIYATNGGKANGTRGGQLIVDSWQGDPHDYADSQRILVAQGITGFDKEAVHGLVTRNVNLVEEGGNSYLEVSINHKGANKNHMQQRISDALTASEGADGRLGELVEAMFHTGSEGDALAALNSLGGSAIAGTMAAQMDASRDHMRTLRGAIGQPQMQYIPASGKGGLVQWEKEKNLWAMATGASGNVGNDSKGGMGYTRHDAGVLAGADLTLSHSTLVGVAAGYSRSHVESCSQTNSADHYFVDVYGRYNHGKWSHSATLGAGVYDWDLKRTVHVKTGDLYADFNGQGRGAAKGTGLNFSYEVAYTINLKENHTLAPVFQLESSYNHIEGYREYGTLGNAGLDVDFKDAFMVTLGLGARYAYAFDGFGSSDRKGHVGARLMGVLDAADTNGEMTGRFIGSSAGFSVESTEHSRVGLLLGADTLVPVSKQWSVFGHASFEIREDYRDISAGAGVKYTF